MPSEIALKKDAPLPPLEKGTLRLYSMRFCPYAQRSRLVLEHHKVPFETVNIHLRSKPDWFWDKNPNGTVPVYEKDGNVLYESRVLCDFFDQIYGNGELHPKDPFQKAKANILIESAPKVSGPYYKLLLASKDDQNQVESIKLLFQGLQFFEERLEGNFFSGSTVSMADYHLWPHMERLEGLGQTISADLMPKDRFPKLNAWVSNMKTTPGVKATFFPAEMHQALFNTVKEGKPDYDYGL